MIEFECSEDERKVIENLRARHAQGENWREITADYPGVTHGSVYKFATTGKGGAKVRRVFGLPIFKPAPACECGDVHVSKTCPHAPKQYRDLFATPMKTLRWMLDNRQEMK